MALPKLTKMYLFPHLAKCNYELSSSFRSNLLPEKINCLTKAYIAYSNKATH